MALIEIETLNQHLFLVHINAASPTQHQVTIQPDYAHKLTQGKVSNDVLVLESFKFLLANEPNTSILRVFDLNVIGRYFPHYEKTILQKIHALS